jgi:hypothetical protein
VKTPSWRPHYAFPHAQKTAEGVPLVVVLARLHSAKRGGMEAAKVAEPGNRYGIVNRGLIQGCLYGGSLFRTDDRHERGIRTFPDCRLVGRATSSCLDGVLIDANWY